MTILDRGASSKKEDNAQGRQTNYENGNRKQRNRLSHSARERAPSHSRSIPAPNVNAEYDYWATAPMVHRNPDSPFDNDAAHLQEMNIRGHLKPKGLSKSGMSLSSASDAQSAVAESAEDQNSQLVNAVVSPTVDLNIPSSSYSIKNLGRHGKKHVDKKVAHKKKHRRTVPYSQTGKIIKPGTQMQVHRKVKSQDGVQGACDDPSAVSSTYVPTTLLSHTSDHQQFHNNHEAANRYCQYPSNASATVTNAVFPDHYSNRVVVPAAKNTRTSPILLNPEQTSSDHEKEDCDDINKDIKNNSDDECDQARMQRLHHGVDFKTLEVEFEEKLKKIRGFVIKPMAEDGACLFRAVADQVYGDQNMHDEVRKNCMNYMVKNADYFSNYVTEDFKAYIDRKRDLHAYGNNLEMQAMVELYNRPFEVYQYSTDPINTFQTSHPSANPPIRVSYHQNLHYNSVVDPHTATIGVGLGLPSFKPGQADKSMLNAAIEASCEVWEQQMLNDKVQATDWESTDDAILEQVARESYMEYMDRKRTSEIQEVKPDCLYERKKSPSQNTKPNDDIAKVEPSKIVKEFPKKNSRPSNPIDGDWVAEEDEWQVLSQVLANSQQEYMDALKHQATHSKATCSKYT